ncbi:hypothetical protein E4656_01860 [Natronospirillum operosum]|uniref:histidine kinase n=1 Tax=Natronospirillum operosum TaxID=2759953 RepID=A0A4Z0WDV8_9GAMM|nr:ATP-binding protein [Natronospirillum operosum]TGG95190.1 hypothetical protein E4656_01860 [Natronospirillum operosum]
MTVIVIALISIEAHQRRIGELQAAEYTVNALNISNALLQIREKMDAIGLIRSEYLAAVQLSNFKVELEAATSQLRQLSGGQNSYESSAAALMAGITGVERLVQQKNDLLASRSILEINMQNMLLQNSHDERIALLLTEALGTQNLLKTAEIEREIRTLYAQSSAPDQWTRVAFADSGILKTVEDLIVNQEQIDRQLRSMSDEATRTAADLRADQISLQDHYWFSPVVLTFFLLVTLAVIFWLYSAYIRQRALGQMNEQSRLDSLGMLSGEVAHDISNMVSVVIGSLNLLREDQLNSRSRTLDKALYAAEKSIQMIDRLLMFARRKQLRPEIISVNELIRGLEEIIILTCGDHIDIRLNLCEEELFLKVDPNLLESSLINLCLNARNAIDDTGTILIEVRGHENQQVTIAVEDDGRGIPKAALKRVFEPFYSFSANGHPKGQGLGLSMVYGFTRQSGGTLTIQSTVNKGTRVEMIFNAH